MVEGVARGILLSRAEALPLLGGARCWNRPSTRECARRIIISSPSAIKIPHLFTLLDLLLLTIRLSAPRKSCHARVSHLRARRNDHSLPPSRVAAWALSTSLTSLVLLAQTVISARRRRFGPSEGPPGEERGQSVMKRVGET